MSEKMVQTSNGCSISLSNLIEYLRRMKNLEGMRYEQQHAIARLKRRIKSVNSNDVSEETLVSTSRVIKDGIIDTLLIALGTFIILLVLFVIVAGWLFFIEADAPWAGKVFNISSMFVVIIPVIIAVGGSLISIAVNVNKCNSLNYKIRKKNKKIRQSNMNSRDAIKIRNAAYTKEIAMLQNKLAQTEAMIKKGYSYNIIHPNYRGLIYIHSLYQYFETGRCWNLLGHEGAYNLLEQDIKFNVVINKLDVIIDKLDTIAENQRQLYNTIVSASNHINSLEKQMGKIALSNNITNERLENIQYNTQISAYNTEYSKWLQTLGYLERR